MVAISLNIQQRVHPVIWTVTGLPFDCIQVLPVKKPIGKNDIKLNKFCYFQLFFQYFDKNGQIKASNSIVRIKR